MARAEILIWLGKYLIFCGVTALWGLPMACVITGAVFLVVPLATVLVNR